jgi:hypothetical protein
VRKHLYSLHKKVQPIVIQGMRSQAQSKGTHRWYQRSAHCATPNANRPPWAVATRNISTPRLLFFYVCILHRPANLRAATSATNELSISSIKMRLLEGLSEHEELGLVVDGQDTGTGNTTENVGSGTLEERLDTLLGDDLATSVDGRLVLDGLELKG